MNNTEPSTSAAPLTMQIVQVEAKKPPVAGTMAKIAARDAAKVVAAVGRYVGRIGSEITGGVIEHTPTIAASVVRFVACIPVFAVWFGFYVRAGAISTVPTKEEPSWATTQTLKYTYGLPYFLPRLLYRLTKAWLANLRKRALAELEAPKGT